MYLPIMLHVGRKFRLCLIFSNCFNPKLILIKLKKLNNKLHFPFSHCFLWIFFIIIISIVFMTRKKIFGCLLHYGTQDEVDLYQFCKYLISTTNKEQKKIAFTQKSRELKGATKSYFTHYPCVVIILFNTALFRSAFSMVSIRKLVFGLSALSLNQDIKICVIRICSLEAVVRSCS